VFTKSNSVALVGLGNVGLPLSLAFARGGLNILGLDNDPAKVRDIPVVNLTRENANWTATESVSWSKEEIAKLDAVAIARRRMKPTIIANSASGHDASSTLVMR
jgi:UDP-N-acetyl-D-mannosaminuronate dehydrogenase